MEGDGNIEKEEKMEREEGEKGGDSVGREGFFFESCL